MLTLTKIRFIHSSITGRDRYGGHRELFRFVLWPTERLTKHPTCPVMIPSSMKTIAIQKLDQGRYEGQEPRIPDVCSW
jgi:hypothetical protein